MSNHITKAKAIARIAHAGQKYGDGDYFANHVAKVAGNVQHDPNARYDHVVVAYLHDVVEDTAFTLVDLADFGYGTNILDAVDALTRKDGENYLDDYIPRLKRNDLAALVKKHDLIANMNDQTPPSMMKRNAAALEILS